MFKTGYLSATTGILAVGAAALLVAHYGSLGATPEHLTQRDVRPVALPFGFDLDMVYPWAAGSGTPTSSAGMATLSTIRDETTLAAAGALQTANQFGPFSFDLNSIRAFSANQAPPGSTQGNVNFTDADQWTTGIAGLANSTGVLGITTNVAAYDPDVANYAGVLQTSNNFGPAFFDLNVLKAIGFNQAPTGALLPSGQPDQIDAVDIGRFAGGVPGVLTVTGTTGFVDTGGFGNGLIGSGVGGLNLTTQVGPQTFDFNFLPAVRGGVIPPGISFSNEPDLTAADTQFAASSPPPPGVVVPLISEPAPKAVRAATVSDPPPADPDGATPKRQTSLVSDTKPPAVIPGVNGAPIAKKPKTATSGVPGRNPFKVFTDVISNGLDAFTGTKPAADGPSAGPSAGPDTGGGTGSEDSG